MKKIKYLVMDVDGTLTDGKIYIGVSGEVCKAFNIKDGYGICNIAMKKGIIPIIITGRKSRIVKMRCNELGIRAVYQGIDNKLTKLLEITNKLSEVAYIGDDLIDFECMEKVKKAGGFVGCPADATKKIKDMCDFVSEFTGGEGAVRDFIEWLVEQEYKD